jgi:hypothetical protein
MRKFLDKILCKKKWCMLVPILVAACIYLLFIILGESDNKLRAILTFPILSALCFFGVFLVVYAQVKNKMCPEWFLNLFELAVIFASAFYIIKNIVQFFVSGCQNLDFGLCLGLMMYSAVCWAHSKRE